MSSLPVVPSANVFHFPAFGGQTLECFLLSDTPLMSSPLHHRFTHNEGIHGHVSAASVSRSNETGTLLWKTRDE
ncbi:hypothetical protein VZT92_025416 [Zoarces viviparus]|uniref:Uncharacterized protein n=1 Tax=Zoarces viviparus TaxID=48416 RepID=A0AAW1DX59_ZOAVI